MNHEYRNKIANESGIIGVKRARIMNIEAQVIPLPPPIKKYARGTPNGQSICQDAESKKIWKKMNHKNFPKHLLFIDVCSFIKDQRMT